MAAAADGGSSDQPDQAKPDMPLANITVENKISYGHFEQLVTTARAIMSNESNVVAAVSGTRASVIDYVIWA